MPVNSITMWWQVVFQVSCLLFVEGMQIAYNPLMVGPTRNSAFGCLDYTNQEFTRMMNQGRGTHMPLFRKILTKRSFPDVPAQFTIDLKPMSRRMDSITIIDNLIPRGDYLVKEHAKLVHDINSLRQAAFVRPFVEENRDYDDSIFHELIETATTSTPGPSTFGPSSFTTRSSSTTTTKGSSIPIILIGGASQRQVVKSQPISFAKPTVSLVGTTVSPVVKHPYPFVMQRKPVKICVTSLPPILTQPKPKTLWQRLLDYFVPRRLGAPMSLTAPAFR